MRFSACNLKHIMDFFVGGVVVYTLIFHVQRVSLFVVDVWLPILCA